jgi:hypothetical protein
VVEPESILEARETAVADFLEGVEAAPAGFPLRDERKQEVLDLLAKAAPGRRTGEVTVLPATPETGATNLYLVLWGGRDVRAYYGEATRDRFVLRTTIYPHPAPLKQNKALVVPSSAALKRAAAKDPASLRYLVRNLGGVLATVVQHARACRPHFMLADEDDAPAVRRIRRRFPGGIVLLDATQKPALYVMLRPVGEAPGEFSEFDAALFTAKGAPDVVHIPSAAALSRMAEQSPEGLIELIERLRKLIRTLVQLIEHG